MMKLSINERTASLAITLIVVILLNTFLNYVSDLVIPEYVGLGLEVVVYLSEVYLLLFLMNFLSQVLNERNLHFPLLAWIILISLTKVLNFLNYSGIIININGYPRTLLAMVFLIIRIILVVKIFTMTSNPYKFHLRLFAILIIVHMILSIATPFVLYRMADAETFDPIKANLVTKVIIDLTRLSQLIPLLLLLFKFKAEKDKSILDESF